ncbi:MAG: very short patch repair endonuclease [Candidatus Anammoxibacter sp.]
MTDHLTQEKRSWNMGLIRSKHSKPEVIIRSLLHRSGIRFRINNKKLPGCPDVVILKYSTIVFVHGCFWHRHQNCKKATFPKTNIQYWDEKFKKNSKRDGSVKDSLEKIGWNVIVIWECEILKNPNLVLKSLLNNMEVNERGSYYSTLKKDEILKVAEKRSKYLISRKR